MDGFRVILNTEIFGQVPYAWHGYEEGELGLYFPDWLQSED